MPFAGISLFTFKRLVEIQELFGAEFFGADGRRPIQKFNGRLDFLLVVIASKGIRKRLALLRECGTHKVKESVGRLEGIFARCQKHCGTVDIRLWRKMLRPDFAENLRVGEGGDEVIVLVGNLAKGTCTKDWLVFLPRFMSCFWPLL